MAREKRSLGVRAHLHRLWRDLVKKSAPRLVLVYKEIAGLLKKMMMMMKNMMIRKSKIAYERILAWQTGGR